MRWRKTATAATRRQRFAGIDFSAILPTSRSQACPPSALYRFRKFARRNKARLAGASILVAASLSPPAELVGHFGTGLREKRKRPGSRGSDRRKWPGRSS